MATAASTEKHVHLYLGIVGTLLLAGVFVAPRTAPAQAAGFTIEQALSAPFTGDLRAAPVKGRLAWVANIDGRRNLWFAEPASGSGYTSRQITHYTADDGQELSPPEWTADAERIVGRELPSQVLRAGPRSRTIPA